MELEALKSLIKAAFADTEYPGDDHIAGCSRSLTPIGCGDCDPIAAHFKGTTWQEHNLQTLAGYDDAVALFHPEARRYYLPAFMLAELENRQSEEEPDPLPNLDISYRFLPSEYESIQEDVKVFTDLLSDQQKQAVIEYLKYMVTDEGVYDPDENTLKAMEFLKK